MENINDNVDEVVGGENTTPETKENETENVVEETTAEVVVEETAVEAGSVEEKIEETVAEDTATEEVAAETETEETVAEVSAAEATTEETTEEAAEAVAETVVETSVEESAEEVTPVKKDSDLPRRIKIGVIVAGGIFVIGALAYAIAFMGGKTSNIVAETEVTKALEELEQKEEAVAVEETVEEEVVEVKEIVEDDPECLVNIVNGNKKYENCIYADAGVIIVKNGEKYGATNYKGQEIVACKYEELNLAPNKEGYFVLSNSKTETVTEESEGTTLSYEATVTDYALFDNEGKVIYEGNSAVIPTGEFYILNVEDDKDERKNRNEYYKISDNSKPVLTLYTNGEFVNSTFKDGVMAVYGFEKPTTAKDDVNPEKVKYGLMDETGKVSWYTAPGVSEFKKLREDWEKKNANSPIVLLPGDKENQVTPEVTQEPEEMSEETEASNTEINESNGEDNTEIQDNEEDKPEEQNDNTDDTDDENDNTAKITPGVGDDMEVEDNGPKYKMGRIMNTPNQGYFLYIDKENSPYVLSMYTEKGEWFADVNMENMKADAKAGFVVEPAAGVTNQVSSYFFNGDHYYNYGTELLLQIGEKYVLCDLAKSKGMTSDKLVNTIVLGTYDYASLGESVFWVTYADKKYTYIEHSGKATNHVFDYATQFDYGYATVVEKGVARIISDSFEDIQELEKTNDTEVNGDLFKIVLDGKSRYYILKEKKSAPTADLTQAVKPEEGMGAGKKNKQ